MFKWLRRESATEASPIDEIGSHTDLEPLLRRDPVVLFKHSAACPVSWAAHCQVTRFRRRRPDVPVYMVHVIKDRPVSQRIAELTGVPHASPQVIVLRNGEVTHSASHGEITENQLAQFLEP